MHAWSHIKQIHLLLLHYAIYAIIICVNNLCYTIYQYWCLHNSNKTKCFTNILPLLLCCWKDCMSNTDVLQFLLCNGRLTRQNLICMLLCKKQYITMVIQLVVTHYTDDLCKYTNTCIHCPVCVCVCG